jgi:hypothetical protein
LRKLHTWTQGFYYDVVENYYAVAETLRDGVEIFYNVRQANSNGPRVATLLFSQKMNNLLKNEKKVNFFHFFALKIKQNGSSTPYI